MKLLVLFITIALLLAVTQAEHYAFMGACKSHSRSKSWATYCLNRVFSNTMGKVATVSSNGKIKVKKSGYYRVNAWAIQHSGNEADRFARVMVSGKIVRVNRVQDTGWTTNRIEMTFYVKAGETFWVDYMASGSNPYPWHAFSHSSFSAMFVGGHIPMLVGGCKNPDRGLKSWKNQCFDTVRSNTMKDYLSYTKAGVFTAKKDGYYKVNGWLSMQAGNHYRLVAPPQTWATHGNSNTMNRWRHHDLNFVYQLKKGQSFRFSYWSYRAIGAYADEASDSRQEVQISYEGAEKRVYKGYCSGHRRGGWHVYCLDKEMFNSMGEQYMVPSNNGHLKITKAGVYNFRTQAIQHFSGHGTTHSIFYVNGKNMGQNYYLDKNWRDNIAQGYLQLKEGDDVYVKFYANNYAFHSGPYWSHMEFSFEEALNLMDTSGGLTKRHGKESGQLQKLLTTIEMKLKGEMKAAEIKTREDSKILKMKKRQFEDATAAQDQESTDLEELKIRINSELELIAKVKALVKNGMN